ncbi:hypothetical protein [Leptospira santarosai]|uniref:Guanylate cyclase domain-containing protein n=1 Tax=Leptospira santarosai TaxID=28183 RepID=A0AB73MPX1_9LEPT|nr:hypothetical protein [Leptospira santarosai]AVV50602.1 Uncharacterized protein XB17_02018 [Leptospira santarosai]ONF92084.1 hypothetical protein BWD14_14115 [Leptospira santarosai]
MEELFSGLANYEDFKRDLKQSELIGTIILFDMTSSTNLKVKLGFPGWVTYLEKFSSIIEESFPREKFKWRKFLGDAYLFFIPSEDNESELLTGLKNVYQMSPLSAREIFSLTKQVMDSYWNFYKPYSKRERGQNKNSEFREITCAIDFGGEIVNWSQFQDTEGVFDPVGSTVDRCFRISSIAGPGQLLFSKDFKTQLEDDTLNPLNKSEYFKLSFPQGNLKGFPLDDSVFFRIPRKDYINHILSPNQAELIELSQPMSIKAKIKLLENNKTV